MTTKITTTIQYRNAGHLTILFVSCSLQSLSLGHYCWQEIFTQLCPSMFVCLMFTAISFSWSILLAGYLHSVVFIHVCLFDVHCYLFLLVIIVDRISSLSCVHPCLFVWCSLLSLSLGHYCWQDIFTQLCSSMFVWCSLLSLSLGHYCWQDIFIQLRPAMKNQ